jgi:hypothetical protein
MTAVPLRYLSESALEALRGSVPDHLNRYIVEDFRDFESENGWRIESEVVRLDTSVLDQLDPDLGDVPNSLLVHQALIGMTPAFATEERMWVRLTHVECLRYTRERWLRNPAGGDLAKAVKKHAFAAGRTGIRDDNAISRLWWNVHVATIADPDDPGGALELIATTADIRQAFVERPGTAARRPLARALVRAMRRDPWLTAAESNFREFMKVLNREGGGVLFEALPDEVADRMMEQCAKHARERAAKRVPA